MALSVWSDELKLGIGSLDREHREQFEAIGEIQAAVGQNAERSVMGPLLIKLTVRTRAHFASEESMMGANKYPGLVLHALKHQYLLQQLDAFDARYERGGFTLTDHSLNFLSDWLTTHFQKEDLSFSLWLNEHGKR